MPTNMEICRIANLALLSFVLSIALATAARADDKAVPGWDPAVFRDASTIKIMTTEPDVGEHWSNLWVVVIDGQPYVRLGDRSYGRIQKNSTSPYVKLKVADQEFDKVKVEEMPDMKEKVAAAMADKYWMDVLIRHESHPMVARLVPEATPPGTPSH
jgi:predicted DNA-binding protein (MmcQ/YjbR family)